MRKFLIRLTAGVGFTLVGQILYAVLRPVPYQPEFDASGLVGSGEATQRWLVLGDSTTTAPGVGGPDDIWVRQLAARFDFPVEIVSLAVGGSRARDVVREQLDRAVATRADIAFVSVGANDVLKGVSLADFTAHLDEIVRRLTEVHDMVVVSGVGDLATIPRLRRPLSDAVRRRGRVFDRVSAAIAERYGAAKVDNWATAARFREPGMFSPDLFHPTPAGHTIWADAVEAVIRPKL